MGGEDRAQLLAVGRVQTSHGLKGYLKVRSLSGEIEHFLRLKSVHLGFSGVLTPFRVEDVRRGVGTVLLKLAGIDTRETAAGYRGRGHRPGRAVVVGRPFGGSRGQTVGAFGAHGAIGRRTAARAAPDGPRHQEHRR